MSRATQSSTSTIHSQFKECIGVDGDDRYRFYRCECGFESADRKAMDVAFFHKESCEVRK